MSSQCEQHPLRFSHQRILMTSTLEMDSSCDLLIVKIFKSMMPKNSNCHTLDHNLSLRMNQNRCVVNQWSKFWKTTPMAPEAHLCTSSISLRWPSHTKTSTSNNLAQHQQQPGSPMDNQSNRTQQQSPRVQPLARRANGIFSYCREVRYRRLRGAHL